MNDGQVTEYLQVQNLTRRYRSGDGVGDVSFSSAEGSRLIVALFLIPVMSTPIVSGLQWRIIQDHRYGPVNCVIGFFGLEPLSGLSAIPRQIYEASSVNGSNLPLLKPMFSLVILLWIIFIFKNFDPAYFLTGGGPGVSTETRSLLTYIRSCQGFQELQRRNLLDPRGRAADNHGHYSQAFQENRHEAG